MRGVPAIVRINVSILIPLYASGKSLTSSSAWQGTPGKAAASLKILGVNRVIGISLSSDLDMSFQNCAAGMVQRQHLTLAGAGPLARKEPELSLMAEVFLFQPTIGFVRMCPLGPPQQLIVDGTSRVPKGFG